MATKGAGGGGTLWNPAGVVARGVSEGLSGRQIIAALRESGMGLREATVRRMIGETRAAIANRPLVGGLDTSILPGPEHYAQWTTNRRGYSTQMLVMTRDTATGIIGEQVSSYTTSDPHTIDEAMAAKLADFQDEEIIGDSGTGQQLLGVMPWNIFQMGPE
jgi:hypothetical protein